MEDYRVQLDNYHGPLDLLLYLIKRDEIDIHDIPVAHITEQYLAHIEHIKRLDINLAGEFLVMAATLMEIKSALLVPHEAEEGDEALPAAEDPTDPRYELIQQLLAYKRFKDAAYQLDDRREEYAARFARKPARLSDDPEDKLVELDMDDISLWDLVEAFGRMMDQIGIATARHDVTADDTPIELHATDIVDRLEREGPMTLQQVFEGRRRGEMLGLFLALLELARQRRLRFSQDQRQGEIAMALRDPAEVEAELAGEVEAESIERETPDPKNADDFDWPSEAVKERYIRRQQRRARGEFILEDEELAADIASLEAGEEHVPGSKDHSDSEATPGSTEPTPEP